MQSQAGLELKFLTKQHVGRYNQAIEGNDFYIRLPFVN
jgi:hypothetical protein